MDAAGGPTFFGSYRFIGLERVEGAGFVVTAIGLITRVGSLDAGTGRLDVARGLPAGAAAGEAAVIALLFMALLLSDRLTEQLRKSRLADGLTRPAEWVEERLSPIFERPVERTITRL